MKLKSVQAVRLTNAAYPIAQDRHPLRTSLNPLTHFLFMFTHSMTTTMASHEMKHFNILKHRKKYITRSMTNSSNGNIDRE